MFAGVLNRLTRVDMRCKTHRIGLGIRGPGFESRHPDHFNEWGHARVTLGVRLVGPGSSRARPRLSWSRCKGARTHRYVRRNVATKTATCARFIVGRRTSVVRLLLGVGD